MNPKFFKFVLVIVLDGLEIAPERAFPVWTWVCISWSGFRKISTVDLNVDPPGDETTADNGINIPGSAENSFPDQNMYVMKLKSKKLRALYFN